MNEEMGVGGIVKKKIIGALYGIQSYGLPQATVHT